MVRHAERRFAHSNHRILEVYEHHVSTRVRIDFLIHHMSLRPSSRRPMPRSPVSRWNLLSNEGKTVNLFREYAANPSTRIRWVYGHGTQISKPGKVPPGTFVVFMGAPGQFTSSGLLPSTSKAYTSIRYLRNVFAGREANILPTRLGYWKTHVYGPGNTFPDLKIDMWDYEFKTFRVRQPNGSIKPVHVKVNTPLTPVDWMCGVKDMSTGRKTLYKKTRTVSQVISRAPGIYLIMACRASGARTEGGNAERNYERSITAGQTTQRFVRRVPAGIPSSAVNFNVQAFENAQARVATRKRMRSPTTRGLPRRPSPSRRNYGNANTVMRNV